MSDEWPLPIGTVTLACVLKSTDCAKDFATLICTFIDIWACDHNIDKVEFATHIADMVKRKTELDKLNQTRR